MGPPPAFCYRRAMYRLVLLVVLLVIPFHAAAESRGTFRVTLLGTGTPRPVIHRFGPSILVEAGPEVLLFDVGRGSYLRLEQTGLNYARLTGICFTHLHSDHVVGLPDLWLSGWLVARRKTPLEVWGPAGTAEMVDRLREAYRFDMSIRVSDDKAAPEGGRLLATDIDEQVVLDRNGVKVTSFRVDHEPVKPALGFRVDYGGHSVVLSGDTRKSQNLVAHARGVDVLIHEVAAAGERALEEPLTRSILATTPPRARRPGSSATPLRAWRSIHTSSSEATSRSATCCAPPGGSTVAGW